MITNNEIIKDLEKVKRKVEYSLNTFPKNDLWPEVYLKLEDLISTIKKDSKIFGY